MGFVTELLYSQLLVSLPCPTMPLTDQTIIISGSNTGLGFEAAKHCVRLHAAKVILAVRDLSKGATAKAAIEAAYPTRITVIDVWHLDLLSSVSIKEFVVKVMELERLDAVLENAGMASLVWREMEGMESIITTNVISTELLALLVLPKLQETARRWNVQPRLSIVTSESHFVAKFEERKETDILAALNREVGANMDDRYAVSKLLQVFFVRELAKKISQSEKPPVIVNCLTPGACHSSIHREFTGWKKWSMAFLKMIIARKTEAGSRTLIAGITAGMDSHGQYMADCLVARPSEFVMSDEGADLQKRLWNEIMKKLETIQPGIEKNI